jgi:uncharacterized protein YggU (UPF0235/DUF167 family)
VGRQVKKSARVSVRLRPRGRGDALLGFEGGVLRARVSAPPTDGRANRALCRLIADRLGVAPSRVSVVHGAKSRDKVVEVESVGPEVLAERLAG